MLTRKSKKRQYLRVQLTTSTISREGRGTQIPTYYSLHKISNKHLISYFQFSIFAKNPTETISSHELTKENPKKTTSIEKKESTRIPTYLGHEITLLNFSFISFQYLLEVEEKTKKDNIYGCG